MNNALGNEEWREERNDRKDGQEKDEKGGGGHHRKGSLSHWLKWASSPVSSISRPLSLRGQHRGDLEKELTRRGFPSEEVIASIGDQDDEVAKKGGEERRSGDAEGKIEGGEGGGEGGGGKRAFDYLLSMPLSSLTQERVDRLRSEQDRYVVFFIVYLLEYF